MSLPQRNGWFSNALNDAVAKRDARGAQSASKSAQKAGDPPAQAATKPEKTRKSLRDMILETTRDVGTAEELGSILQDVKDCQASQEIVDRFIVLVHDLYELFIYNFSQDMPTREANDKWESMSWDEREAQFNEWAKQGNEEIQTRMIHLLRFYTDADGRENTLLKIFLRGVFDQFVYPLQWINTVRGLQMFLDDLADPEPPKTPMVKKIYNPKFVRDEERGVVIELGEDKFLYLPQLEVPKTARAWPYIKKTEARVNSLAKQINALQAQATPDLTPVKISNGQQGCLFLALSGKEAVLMQAKRDGTGQMAVSIVKSVGADQNDLPQDSQPWDVALHRPGKTTGKWFRVAKALDHWKTEREMATRVHKEKRGERLSPIVDAATMPIRFEELGLTRIFQGEEGVMSFYRDNFSYDGNKGLFGVAINHIGNKTYVLEAVIWDFGFPRQLIGEKLPLEVDHNAGTAMLQRLPSMRPEKFRALRMVETLIKIRLKEEARHTGAEQEGSAQ